MRHVREISLYNLHRLHYRTPFLLEDDRWCDDRHLKLKIKKKQISSWKIVFSITGVDQVEQTIAFNVAKLLLAHIATQLRSSLISISSSLLTHFFLRRTSLSWLRLDFSWLVMTGDWLVSLTFINQIFVQSKTNAAAVISYLFAYG